MTSDLRTFDAELRRITSEKADIRPFVCDGSPLDCQIFIVGFNPATTNVSFWDFWRLPYGFDKKSWLLAYESQREKQHQKRQSNTRQRIERIVQAAWPVRCLETNICAIPSRKQRDLQRESRSTEVFDFLMRRIQPRVIFVHGTPAVEHMRQPFGLGELKPPRYGWISRPVKGMTLFAGSHLAIGWSLESAAELGKELRARCGR
jgi:hypothetical protein